MASNLTTQDAQNLHSVFEEILNALIQSAAQHFEAQSGGKIKASDKLKLSLATKVFDMSKKFNSEAKIGKLIDVSNKIVPILGDYVDDEVVLKNVPPQYRDVKTMTLLDKAGAKELSNLFKKLQPELAATMIVVPVAVVAAPVVEPAEVVLPPVPASVAETVIDIPAEVVVQELEEVPAFSTVGRIESTLTRRVESTVGHAVPSTVSAPQRRVIGPR